MQKFAKTVSLKVSYTDIQQKAHGKYKYLKKITKVLKFATFTYSYSIFGEF